MNFTSCISNNCVNCTTNQYISNPNCIDDQFPARYEYLTNLNLSSIVVMDYYGSDSTCQDASLIMAQGFGSNYDGACYGVNDVYTYFQCSGNNVILQSCSGNSACGDCSTNATIAIGACVKSPYYSAGYVKYSCNPEPNPTTGSALFLIPFISIPIMICLLFL